MTEYLIFKLERFMPEGGGHVINLTKYWCEVFSSKPTHPYTDENPHRLFGKIASLYKKGDSIKTIPQSELSNSFDGEEVQLKAPLSHDELRILAIQVLEELGKKK